MQIDRHTPTWKAVEQWVQERRAMRVQSLINGSPNDDKLRGEIRLIDDLLAHASEDPEPDIQPGPDY